MCIRVTGYCVTFLFGVTFKVTFKVTSNFSVGEISIPYDFAIRLIEVSVLTGIHIFFLLYGV
jgi:hypothetical protein